MPIYGNISGAQKEIKDFYGNIDGVNSEQNTIYGNINSVSKQMYSSSIITSLSNINTGSMFWINDSEGFSEYKILGRRTYQAYPNINSSSYVFCIKRQALDINIVSALQNFETSIMKGDMGLTVSIFNLLSNYASWANSNCQQLLALSRGYNEGETSVDLAGLHKCFLYGNMMAYQDYDNYINNEVNVFYFNNPNGQYISRNTPMDIINTKTKNDVKCYYNTFAYDGDNNYDELGASEGTYYVNYPEYVQSGNKNHAYQYYYRYATNPYISWTNLPSELYVRPCIALLETQNVTIYT